MPAVTTSPQESPLSQMATQALNQPLFQQNLPVTDMAALAIMRGVVNLLESDRDTLIDDNADLLVDPRDPVFSNVPGQTGWRPLRNRADGGKSCG